MTDATWRYCSETSEHVGILFPNVEKLAPSMMHFWYFNCFDIVFAYCAMPLISRVNA